MRVLIACEESGTVRDAFRTRGHEAFSCDILETSKPSPFHIIGDAREQLDKGWDLLIAHPPCTYLSNSGVCHLYTEPGRVDLMWEAVDFFNVFWKEARALIPRIAVENPIMHGYAKKEIGKQAQTVQPWQFGHPEQKATCLWLHNLPNLTPTNNVYEEMLKLPPSQRQRLHYLSPGPDRQRLRSQTFPGLAAAMAEQWGAL